MTGPAHFPALLATVKTIPLELTLVRNVPLASVIRKLPPNFLFTSGKPNRFNMAGIACVYFSEEEETVRLEYDRGIGSLCRKQPLTTFWAKVKLRRVVDLADPVVLKHMVVGAKDLSAPWVGATVPTLMQELGNAVAANGHNISAIRYPSDAAKVASKAGHNVVIFRDQIKAPDFVHILGPGKEILQKWP